MDQSKSGALIKKLRQERGLTQKALAESIGVSDKAVSKWERGLGCPDVSLLKELSSTFRVNIESLLEGTLEPNMVDGGNMKKVKFYVCPICGNILTSTAVSVISCCGRVLEAQIAQPVDDEHRPVIEPMDGELYVTLSHEMTKAHHLSFAAYVTYDRMLFIRLYPEQDAAFRMPQLRGGKLYLCCTQHGLMMA